MSIGRRNLEAAFAQADKVDIQEGLLAYDRYHQVMVDIANHYDVELSRVCAVFCALSPNNDYDNNLRSTISVIHGFKEGWTVHDVEVSTYRHCLHRAWDYMHGRAFLDAAMGLKIRNFYMNVHHPEDHHYVTIDGHMVALYRGKNLTMKQAICKGRREYEAIADATKLLAYHHMMRANQMQAILWFVRKRLFNIKAGNAAQYDCLMPNDTDMWRTYRDVKTIKPFPRRERDEVRVQTNSYGERRRVAEESKRSWSAGLEVLWCGPRIDEVG